MKLQDAFPKTSNYINADDLGEKDWPLTIAAVVTEEVGRDREPARVAKFVGAKKGLVLNITNWTQISTLHGPDDEYWAGKPIILYKTQTRFGHEVVPCVRIRPHAPGAPPPASSAQFHQPQEYAPTVQAPQAPAPGSEYDEPGGGPFDDSIPFAPIK